MLRTRYDHALASWRRSEAIRLKTAGWTYEQIAQELGYANRGTVHRIVSQALEAREAQALEAREAQDVDLLRHLTFDRLEALLAGLWPQAIQGHVPSVQAALKTIEQEMRLVGGMQKPSPKDTWDNCQGPPTVVVNPNDCRHDGCAMHGRF